MKPQESHDDLDIDILLPLMEYAASIGAAIILKWSCPKCGERVMSDDENCFHTEGYEHTDNDCGYVYCGRTFGFALVGPPECYGKIAKKFAELKAIHQGVKP